MARDIAAAPPLPRSFLTVWGGQTASLIGTEASAVGVSMIAYLRTGSVTWLAVLYLASRVPALLVSSHAGALVDRTSHKRVLLVADAAAGVATLGALGLHLTGHLALWHLVALAVVGSVANAYQLPAYQAAVPLLVERTQLGRAHGLLQAGPAASLLAGPALAGVLVGMIGVGGLLVADLVTFAFAVLATASVSFPVPAAREEDEPGRGGSLVATWRHLVGRRRGVRRLVGWASLTNLVVTAVNVLLLALLLPLTSEAGAGLAIAVGGAAMLASSVTVAARGVPERRVRTLVTANAVVALGIVVMGLRPSLPLVLVGLVVTLGAVPVLGAAAGVIFQTEVAEGWQGRLLAFRRLVGESLVPPAVLVVAPLIERLAEPTMLPGGAGADTLGWLLGTGPGRGIGLVYVGVGIAVAALAAAVWFDPWVRALDRVEEPDAPADMAPSLLVAAEAAAPAAATTVAGVPAVSPDGGVAGAGGLVVPGGAEQARPLGGDGPGTTQ